MLSSTQGFSFIPYEVMSLRSFGFSSCLFTSKISCVLWDLACGLNISQTSSRTRLGSNTLGLISNSPSLIYLRSSRSLTKQRSIRSWYLIKFKMRVYSLRFIGPASSSSNMLMKDETALRGVRISWETVDVRFSICLILSFSSLTMLF